MVITAADNHFSSGFQINSGAPVPFGKIADSELFFLLIPFEKILRVKFGALLSCFFPGTVAEHFLLNTGLQPRKCNTLFKTKQDNHIS